MKTHTKNLMLATMATAGLSLGANATTLTFSDGGGNNSDVGLTYGSDIAGDATGYVTTDGSGATPNIALEWLQDSNAIWEFHSGWSGSLDGKAVQMDMDGSQTLDATIDFIPDAGFQVVLNSVDIGMYTSAPSGGVAWDVSVQRVSDSAVVFSHTTAALGANAKETVDFDFTGDVGVAYRLIISDGDASSFEGAIDNLSFSQAVPVPEPGSLALLGLGGVLIASRRRRG